MAETIVAFAFLLLYNEMYKYSALTFCMCFFWGLQDSCISIHVDSILGFEFDSNTEPFSIDCLVESCSVFVFQMLQSTLDSTNVRMYYILFVGCLGVVMCSTTYFFQYRSTKVTPYIPMPSPMSPSSLNTSINKTNPPAINNSAQKTQEAECEEAALLSTSIVSSQNGRQVLD